MDIGSELHLQGVHPDLVRVVRAASQLPQPFRVICGMRGLEAERRAVATGHSETMHSRHLPGTAGYACAVDVAALEQGQISFALGHELEVFGAIAAQIKAAAAQLQVPLEWGGDWTSLKDWGHFQLPWAQYP